MAEMYHKGDIDKNEKLELQEFIRGMLEHPVTSKILRIKKIGKFRRSKFNVSSFTVTICHKPLQNTTEVTAIIFLPFCLKTQKFIIKFF
jgi:hypothetical protein